MVKKNDYFIDVDYTLATLDYSPLMIYQWLPFEYSQWMSMNALYVWKEGAV